MVLESVGAVIGFLSATIPNLFKIWQDKATSTHQLDLLRFEAQQRERDETYRLDTEALKASAEAETAETKALYATFYSGIRFVDGFSALVRPFLAFSFFFLYAFVKISLVFQGSVEVWGEEDNFIFLTIISYFFGQRAMLKIMKK